MAKFDYSKTYKFFGVAAMAGAAVGYIVAIGIYETTYGDQVKKLQEQIQEANRRNIDATRTQPGDMRQWSNPYDSKKPAT